MKYIKRFESIDFDDIDDEEESYGDFHFSDDIFDRFLIKNNIKEKFIYNLNHYSNVEFFRKHWGTLETFCDDLGVGRYISDSFHWDYPKRENTDNIDWSDIDDKWKDESFGRNW